MFFNALNALYLLPLQSIRLGKGFARASSRKRRFLSTDGLIVAIGPGFFMTEEENNKTVEWTSQSEVKTPPAELQKIFDYLFTQYEPVDNPVDADIRKTTLDIFQQVKLHYPIESITPEHIYNTLLKANFKFYSKPGKIDFYWMLKKKPKLKP